jgi:FkbM family methyltransferase
MLALLPHLLSHSGHSVGTVLHIGAGVGSELETYQKLNCENIVAIEPDAALFKKLSAKAKRFNNVEVTQAWIGENNTQFEAHIFANPRFNSLLAADTLLDHFANLKLPKILQVDTLAVNDLLSTKLKLKLDASKQNILVIEVQGFEVRLLKSCEFGLLQHFSLIVVKTSEESLYQYGANAEKVSACLGEKSYDLLLSDTSHLPFVEHYYQLNHSQIALAHAQKKLDLKNQQNLEQVERLSEQLATHVAALQTKQNELAETKKNKGTQLAELTAQRDQQAKGHQETKQQAESLKIQNEKLSADRAQKLTQNEQLTAQITALQAKQNQLAETQKNKDTQIAELTAQRDQQAKGHQETNQQAESLKIQNEKLSAERAQKLVENEQLAAQVKAVQAKHTELAETQKNKVAKIAELTAQRDQQAKGHQETKQQAESLKAQNEKLNADKAQKLTQNEQLAAQVKAVQAKHTELAETQKSRNTQIVDLTAQRDQQAKGHQETRQQAESLKAQNEKLNVDRAQKLTENEQLVAQVKELQAKQNQLAEIQINKDTQIAELTAQRDQQAKGHQETKQQAESLKSQNEKLIADKAQKTTDSEQLVAQVSTLQTKQNELVEGHKNKDAQIEAVTEQRDKEAHGHQKNKNWAESLNKRCEELKVYSAERQKSADLSLKLQTKAQVDLENLREKYQHKHINEQKLVALISELRAKLQQAAEYYHELQEKHPELNEITQTQVERSHIEECQTANVAELENKTRPAKRKKRSKQAKSVTRGKS